MKPLDKARMKSFTTYLPMQLISSVGSTIYTNTEHASVGSELRGAGARKPVKKRMTRMMYVVAGVLIFGVFLTFVNIYELRRLQVDHMALHSSPIVEGTPEMSGRKRPIVWVYGKKKANHVEATRLDSGYLKHVFNVFDWVGYAQGGPETNWDVFWSHDYPFIRFADQMKTLKPHQKVNHFPGSGFITNKVSLATSDIKFIPKAFKIPRHKDLFIQHAKLHPETMWVQKSNNHRGIKIKNLEDLDLSHDDTFIQAYVDNPLLIDARRFDIGIYTLVTSVNPLRVYTMHGDWLVRFCPDEYYPFNPSNTNKYVVSDDYTPVWKVGALKKMYNDLGYNFRESIIAYLNSKGYDSGKLLSDLEEAVRGVFMDKESKLVNALAKYKSPRNFFELVRFDFVLDNDLNIYLMEVNMSPNLSSGHFPPNKRLYEQVIYSTLHLVGLARPTDDLMLHGTSEQGDMQVCSRDVLINADDCASSDCADNCLLTKCKLCPGCLTVDQKLLLREAYHEHINRRTWRRVLPKPFQDQTEAQNWQGDGAEFNTMSSKNQWMFLWYKGMCLKDSSFCS